MQLKLLEAPAFLLSLFSTGVFVYAVVRCDHYSATIMIIVKSNEKLVIFMLDITIDITQFSVFNFDNSY